MPEELHPASVMENTPRIDLSDDQAVNAQFLYFINSDELVKKGDVRIRIPDISEYNLTRLEENCRLLKGFGAPDFTIGLRAFLQAPIIEDKFTDHAVRTNWENSAIKDFIETHVPQDVSPDTKNAIEKIVRHGVFASRLSLGKHSTFIGYLITDNRVLIDFAALESKRVAVLLELASAVGNVSVNENPTSWKVLNSALVDRYNNGIDHQDGYDINQDRAEIMSRLHSSLLTNFASPK